MTQPEHSRIINEVARQVLKPHGIERKGQSRIWLDDHGWFTTIIEFQPFTGKRGTGLNVGVNFHWYRKDHWSFNIGYRESGFLGFESENQFTPEVEKLANLALSKVLQYREELSDFKVAQRRIISHDFSESALWGNYHKGMICGIVGEKTRMLEYFNQLLVIEHNIRWANELKANVEKLINASTNQAMFLNDVSNIITETRRMKKLAEVDFKLS